MLFGGKIRIGSHGLIRKWGFWTISDEGDFAFHFYGTNAQIDLKFENFENVIESTYKQKLNIAQKVEKSRFFLVK